MKSFFVKAITFLLLCCFSQLTAQVEAGQGYAIELFAGNVRPTSQQGPTSLAFDSNGNLFIASGGNLKALKIPAGTNVPQVFGDVSVLDGDGIAVDGEDNVILSGENIVKFSQDGSLLWSERGNIGNTQLVAIDEDDNIYVGSLGDKLAKLSSSGSNREYLGPYAEPSDPVIGPDGYLYISLPYEKQIIKVDRNTGDALEVVLAGIKAMSPVFDSLGLMYFTDEVYGVYKYDLLTRRIDTVAFGFVTPRALAFDLEGNLFVSDRSMKNIYKISSLLLCEDYPCGEGSDRVLVCDQGETLCVSFVEASRFLADGGLCGPCELSSTKQSVVDYNQSIRIFKNPFAYSFFLEVDNDLLECGAEITIHDVLGRTVRNSELLTTNRVEINLAFVPAGIYFYTLKLSDGRLLTGQVVKQY